MAASFVAACMDVLIAKLRRALEEFGDPAVAIVGGVAASPVLRARAQTLADEFGTRLLIPPQSMATDNAAMIGVAGWQKLAARARAPPASGPNPTCGCASPDRTRTYAAAGTRGRRRRRARRPEQVRRQVEQDAEATMTHPNASTPLPGRVDERVEERRVGQEDEADDALPAGTEGNGEPVGEDPEQEGRSAARWRRGGRGGSPSAQSGRPPVAALVDPVSL